MDFPHTAEHELKHVAAMIGRIGRLELLAVQHRGLHTNIVMRPNYWRGRINAVLTRPNLPRSITSQASALMARLDVLSAASDRGPAHGSP